MIIDEIKNSVRNALYSADSNIAFHFEKASHTVFPYAILNIKDFKIEPSIMYDKQKYSFSFELVFQKSEDNTLYELLEFQKKLSYIMLPAILIEDKKITLDGVEFTVSNKQLVMNFKLDFYTYETEETEAMETLDIRLKGE